MKKILLFLFCIFLSMGLTAAPSLAFPSEEEGKLVIHNRVLLKVHKKTISVLDVAKQMEITLRTRYPQYADSPTAKYQFFSSQWKETLLHMIDQELILADAEKMELKITDGEVRETLLERFGPNVMQSLASLHLSYEEAKNLIYTEMVEQRMLWFKVHEKALASVSSKDIKKAYEFYCKKNPPKTHWNYEVLSIRADSDTVAKEVAEKAFSLCSSKRNSLDTLPSILEESASSEHKPMFTISLSQPLEKEDKDLSAAHKEALSHMKKGEIGQPVKQITRASGGVVYRIFHLIDQYKEKKPSFVTMKNHLQEQLIQEAANKGFQTYIQKLREYYGFNQSQMEELIPADFHPFSWQ